MSQFNYIAVMDSGRRVSGVLRCRDRRDAVRRLHELGYHPVSVKPLDDESLLSGGWSRDRFRRVTTSDLAVLTRQMASLMKAGMPMVQVLSTLGRQSSNPRLVRVLQDIEQTIVREAGTLSEALSLHPRIFDAVYRGMVRSGEEAGNLAEVMDHLAGHLAQAARLRGQVLNAFIYPLFLLVLGAAAVFVLITFVIPRFEELFESFGQQLPWPTRVLIACSSVMARWWWAVLGLLFVAGGGAMMSLSRPGVRRQVHTGVLRLPVLGGMVLKIEMARISRTLGALLDSGVQILEALRITGQTARNLAIRSTFDGLIAGVRGGRSLAEVMDGARYYPPLMMNLVQTGEDTGELPEMLSELSAIYEDEAERAVTGAVKLLEPMLIVVMGLIIAGIVAAVILPIFQSNAMVG